MPVTALSGSIRRVLGLLAHASTSIESAAESLTEARDIHTVLLDGTNDQDAALLSGLSAEAVEASNAVADRLRKAEHTLTAYLRRLGVSGQEPTAPPPRTTRQPEASAPDGSHYPAEAEWCVDLLPRRVRAGEGSRTIGYVDGSFSPLQSGQDDTWSPHIRQRAVDLGFRVKNAQFLSSHVEMKAATRMILEGRHHSTLVINNLPCGDKGPMPGCETALPRYLPIGYTLTVHGTNEHGEPYSRTYKGAS